MHNVLDKKIVQVKKRSAQTVLFASYRHLIVKKLMQL